MWEFCVCPVTDKQDVFLFKIIEPLPFKSILYLSNCKKNVNRNSQILTFNSFEAPRVKGNKWAVTSLKSSFVGVKICAICSSAGAELVDNLQYFISDGKSINSFTLKLTVFCLSF